MRGIHWFRHDLRLRDNVALADGLSGVDQWLPVFVLDPRLVQGAEAAPRVRFLRDCIERLGADLGRRGIPLVVRSGLPEEILPELARETGAGRVSFGIASTPFGQRRDARIRDALRQASVETVERMDDAILADGRIRTAAGTPYEVYGAYRRAWWKHWERDPRMPVRAPEPKAAIPGFEKDLSPVLVDREHEETRISLPTGGERAAARRLSTFLEERVARYHEDRDRPDLDGTSRLSPYLHVGAISSRQCLMRALELRSAQPAAREGVDKWLDELVWREFYRDVMSARPELRRQSFHREYDDLEWNHDPEAFAAWSEGRTGFPIVDAGMRQLRQTGWMHNRVRMIVASFLTKDLLIDWREGERFFMEWLVDGDVASNNGGWQWAASTGCDPQPWFRIFNPVLQGRRFDPEGRYVRRWVPELRNVPIRWLHAPWEMERPPRRYPDPIVDHAERRKLALDRFERARGTGRKRDESG